MNRETNSDKKDYLLYEKTAKSYDARRFSGKSGSWGHDRQIAILKELAPDWRGKKVLEIGCGTGRITEFLASCGAEITATDISEEMLKVAKFRFEGDSNLTMPEFRIMSIFDVDIDMGEYDYVIMINVLGRLSRAKEAIAEVSSRISNDCTYIFTFPSLTSILLPFGILVNLRDKSLFRDVTSHWYLPGTIKKFCADANLRIVEYRGNHYVPLPRILFLTYPLFRVWDKLIAKVCPKRCASVFVVCKRGEADNSA